MINMNETTANFWHAWTNTVCSEPQPVSFRLYYQEDGSPVLYTMEDLPGDYIEVDPETYAAASFRVRVVDQRLIHIRPGTQIKKLQPATDTGTSCSPYDVCIVVPEQQPHVKWKITSNETN